MAGAVKIVASADELQEGLFGQILLWVFEILPYLDRMGVRPDWDIRAKFYGGHGQSVLPGVLDLAYQPPAADRVVPLSLLRQRHCSQLGNDWRALHRLWFDYFSLPTVTLAEADAVGPLVTTLGIHYRGTDKLEASWDTNPVPAPDMISIVQDFRRRRPDLTRIFVATDDKAFPAKLRAAVDCEVVNLGEIDFHKEADRTVDNLHGARRALLDCVLLSRCGAVLKTSSALSGFAKVFNPDLEIYRCAASKRFTDIPYFPPAYIEPYVTTDPAVAQILDRLMEGDWRQAQARVGTFRSRPRYLRAALKWGVLERLQGSPVR